MADLKQLNKLQRLFNLMDDDSLTKEQFKRAFTKVVELIKKNDAEFRVKVNDLSKLVDTIGKNLEKGNSDGFSANLLEIKKAMNALEAKQSKDRSSILQKLAEVKDGDDADEELVTEKAANKAAKMVTPLLEKHSGEVVGELNKLGEQVGEAYSRIDDNSKDIEELKKRPKGTVQGGVTNARITQAFKTIWKTEAVQGTIDGVNTTFTVSQTIFAVFSLSLNGEVIAELPNYTISGNTIEFSEALPAVYSGKDFECKFI